MSPKSTKPFSQCYCGTPVQRYTVQAIFCAPVNKILRPNWVAKKTSKNYVFCLVVSRIFRTFALFFEDKRDSTQKKVQHKNQTKKLWH